MSSEITKFPKSWIFTNNYWLGCVRQSNFVDQHSSLFGRCRNIFRAKMGQPPPLEKNGPYAYAQLRTICHCSNCSRCECEIQGSHTLEVRWHRR